MTEKATIIPIAGGKGGIGKSLIAANLAISLAQLGHSTVAIDLDLGGSNLYLLLGLHNEYRGIGDYLNSGDLPFDDLRVQTEWPHLKFIPGDGQTPFLANISFAQKRKLIKKIKSIQADYVVLDLGAGTSFNVLDFFGIAAQGLVVTTTERIALMNMLSFLKNFLLRTIDRALIRKYAARDLLREVYAQPITVEQKTIKSLLDQVDAVDEEAGQCVRTICEEYRPRIVYNMLNHPNAIKILNNVGKSTQNVLSLKVDHLGAVFDDPAVPKSIRKGVPLLKYNPESIAAQSIFALAGEIIHRWHNEIDVPEQNVIENTRKFYDKFTN
ncbi:MAG: MinD/ParA family protein [Proteobacteria bacterium]|nr:MinD/ParA family protein [Pseudomonadota bacterium]